MNNLAIIEDMLRLKKIIVRGIKNRFEYFYKHYITSGLQLPLAENEERLNPVDHPPMNGNLNTYIRSNYDSIWDSITKEDEQIKKMITETQDSLQILEKYHNTIQTFKKIINKKKVGTLEGIVRQKIHSEGIPIPKEYDALISVLEQDYDELKILDQNINGNPYGGKLLRLTSTEFPRSPALFATLKATARSKRISSKNNKTGAMTRRRRRSKKKYYAKR
jgi:hypothetical protein